VPTLAEIATPAVTLLIGLVSGPWVKAKFDRTDKGRDVEREACGTLLDSLPLTRRDLQKYREKRAAGSTESEEDRTELDFTRGSFTSLVERVQHDEIRRLAAAWLAAMTAYVMQDPAMPAAKEEAAYDALTAALGKEYREP